MIIYAIRLVVGVIFTLRSSVAGHFPRGRDGDVSAGRHAEAAPEPGCWLEYCPGRIGSLETATSMSVNPA
jgi:hypothetical protein